MRIMVIDTETSGIDETDQVIEVGVVVIDEEAHETSTMSFIVRPDVAVNVMARAAHHITDREIAGGVPIAGLAKLIPRADVFVAHNAVFDRRMLTQSGVPEDALPPRTICTYQCARHIFPEAPSHSNSVLRYFLDLKLQFPLLHPPHRALPDAIVTAALFERLRRHHDIDELVRLTTAPVLLRDVRFGKHRGRQWADVATDYLRWVAGTPDFDPDVLHTARTILADRERRVREAEEEKRLREVAQKLSDQELLAVQELVEQELIAGGEQIP